MAVECQPIFDDMEEKAKWLAEVRELRNKIKERRKEEHAIYVQDLLEKVDRELGEEIIDVDEALGDERVNLVQCIRKGG